MFNIQLAENIVNIMVFVGGPIIPLLIIAIWVGRWHDANQDPPEVESTHEV